MIWREGRRLGMIWPEPSRPVVEMVPVLLADQVKVVESWAFGMWLQEFMDE